MVVLEIYTFSKGKQDNKWCSLKKFDFSNRTNKVGRMEYYTTYQKKKKIEIKTFFLVKGKQIPNVISHKQ